MNTSAANTSTGSQSQKLGRRERRLARRATRKQLAAAQLELEQLRKLKHVAAYAIRYVGAIDAPNPSEPWDIAKKRDDLVAVVHAHQGRPEKTRRDSNVVPLRPVASQANPPRGGFQAAGFPTQPLPRKQVHMQNGRSREQLARDVEVKRRELRDAAARYGAEANKRLRNPERVSDLGRAVDAAARQFVEAEDRLRAAEAAA